MRRGSGGARGVADGRGGENARYRAVSHSGVPRSMKMGTIHSPWHYDYAAGFAPWRADVFRSLHICYSILHHGCAPCAQFGRMIVKGNDYRLVVAVDFEKSIVWIKWIGTHKDYDKIDVKEVQHDG
jgi:hypothetical protein